MLPTPYAVLAGNISGTIGTEQLLDGSVTAAKIADGAVGSSALGLNVVQASNIAPAAIGSAQLAKPPQSGSIDSRSLTLDFNQVGFTVAFSRTFATTPNVIISLETRDFGMGTQRDLFVVNRSVSSFDAHLALPLIPMTVDSAGDVGGSISLVIVEGNPAISYLDHTSGHLKYVRANDAAATDWGLPLVVDNADTMSDSLSLAVVNGKPAISYRDNGDLKYVRAVDSNGTAWNSPTVVDSVGDLARRTSLAVINGKPAISYPRFFDSGEIHLKYVRANDPDGATWDVPVTLDSDAGFDSHLAIVNGNPAVSYQGPGVLLFVRAVDSDGTTWLPPAIAAGHGSPSSLAVVDSRPAITYLYFDGIDIQLRYVSAKNVNGTDWNAPVVLNQFYDTLPFNRASLAVVGGKAALSYQDSDKGDLKYVRAANTSGTVWAKPVSVQTSGDVGRFHSLAVLADGQPGIGYYDATKGDLKFIRQENTTVLFNIQWIALEP